MDPLLQHWIHSHEEDTDTEMVFRPASFNFPPARGRKGFELSPDGTLIDYRIGPTDRPRLNGAFTDPVVPKAVLRITTPSVRRGPPGNCA